MSAESSKTLPQVGKSPWGPNDQKGRSTASPSIARHHGSHRHRQRASYDPDADYFAAGILGFPSSTGDPAYLNLDDPHAPKGTAVKPYNLNGQGKRINSCCGYSGRRDPDESARFSRTHIDSASIISAMARKSTTAFRPMKALSSLVDSRGGSEDNSAADHRSRSASGHRGGALGCVSAGIVRNQRPRLRSGGQTPGHYDSRRRRRPAEDWAGCNTGPTGSEGLPAASWASPWRRPTWLHQAKSSITVGADNRGCRGDAFRQRGQLAPRPLPLPQRSGRAADRMPEPGRALPRQALRVRVHRRAYSLAQIRPGSADPALQRSRSKADALKPRRFRPSRPHRHHSRTRRGNVPRGQVPRQQPERADRQLHWLGPPRALSTPPSSWPITLGAVAKDFGRSIPAICRSLLTAIAVYVPSGRSASLA